MKIDEIRKMKAEMENYIKLYEEYPQKTMNQIAFKAYADFGNIAKITTMLNTQGARIGNRKLVTNDVSAILQNPTNEFEKHVCQIFLNSKKKATRIWS
jgi:hypothetical protein